MRTTITLEPDVQSLIQRAMKRDQSSFKEVVNAAIRKGLNEAPRQRALVLPSFDMGLLPGHDPDRLNALLDDALTEDAAERLQRLR